MGHLTAEERERQLAELLRFLQFLQGDPKRAQWAGEKTAAIEQTTDQITALEQERTEQLRHIGGLLEENGCLQKKRDALRNALSVTPEEAGQVLFAGRYRFEDIKLAAPLWRRSANINMYTRMATALLTELRRRAGMGE